MELFGKYEVGRLLGCGAFAKVYYARNLGNGQSVAIKVINKKKLQGSTLMSNIKREITIMSRLHHPNIVRLYEVMASKTKIYFVIEFVKGGELFAKVAKGRFSEDLSRGYFRQLVSAVAYCHSRGVFHRDLKPENLLLDDNGNLKVSDFGLSAFKNPSSENSGSNMMLQTLCGTPAYVAPEILAKKGYDGPSVDVWSCGVVLFVLTAGYLPFNDPNLMCLYKKIYKGEYRCPKWMSSDLKRLLSRLLTTNPSTRITLDQILLDPWFSKPTHPNPHPISVSSSFSDDSSESSRSLNYYSSNASLPLLEDTPTSSLNAFDLISFSSGLDLSGLFQTTLDPITQSDRFLSAEPAVNILDEIEKAACTENVKVKKNKEGDVVDLEGPNGNFVARLEINPLTEQLLVVEVKTKGSLFWANKVMPRLSELLHHADTKTPLTTARFAATDASIV